MLNTLKITCALFCFFFLLFSFSLRGFLSFDEETMYVVTESICERGTIEVSGSILSSIHTVTSAHGKEYAVYDLGQSILGIPMFGIGKAVSFLVPPEKQPFFKRFVVNHTGALFGALLVAFCYLFSLQINLKQKSALEAALLTGLATPVFFYSRTFFRAPTLGCAFLGTACFLLLYQKKQNLYVLLFAGACAGSAVFLKMTSAVLYLSGIVFLFLINGGLRSFRFYCSALLFSIPVLFFFSLCVLYNYERFGALFVPSSTHAGFTTPLLIGIWATLFSPGRGILIFAPLLWILPLSFSVQWRRKQERAVFLFVIVCCSLHMLIHCLYRDWHGGSCWGPRYYVPVFALLMPFVVRSTEAFRASGGCRLAKRISIIALVFFSILIQIVGITTEGKTVGATKSKTNEVPFSKQVYYPEYSTGLNIKLWSAVSYLSMKPIRTETNSNNIQSKEFEQVFSTTPHFWWAFLYRLSLPVVYLLPAAAELLLGLICVLWLLKQYYKISSGEIN